ncbi:hypothetical protein GOP47_0007033 [Adiantum capillus-veneris]|uniref:Uncharacterized protein n=1 Tax=Adiantum capillus-veneris TaxID=13818 RepID=A0A9D4V072_ADICA|nr:hypothetical protein GOP47_0007033 [Adiantum capillus-veneris]
MGTTRWGLERSTEPLFARIAKGERDGEEEDHMAGLVQRIAHSMLDEEEDDDGRSKAKSVWELQFEAQAAPSIWDKRITDNAGARPLPACKREESEAMELLYMELVRLKMEELAVAQHQLSLYQKALMDARQTHQPVFASMVGLSNMAPSLIFEEPQQHTLDTSYSSSPQPLQGPTVGGSEWVRSNMMHCHSREQQPGPPGVHPSGQYPARAVTSFGAPTLRESGGTGVFLPRCRTGARQLRILESKRKPDLHFSDSTRCAKSVLPNKRKEDVGRPSLQYASYPPMQEVTPEVSLPTEWTY